MRYELMDYQENAVGTLVTKIKQRQELFNSPYDPEYSAIALSAPTGAGKTVIAAAVLEHLLDSSDILPNSVDTTVLWVTDDPSLNEQTKLKIQLASDRSIRTEVLVPGFDQETLDKGKLYFVNIQAIGARTRLANRSEEQKFSLWETLANTVKERGSNFIVIIDEANHSVQKSAGKRTITSRIIDGTDDTGNHRVPIVIGISAGGRFKAAISDTVSRNELERSLVEVVVPTRDVQESGVVKDRIVFCSPQEAGGVLNYSSSLRDAVRRTKDFSRRWKAYCEEQDESLVLPVLVIQVEKMTTMATINDMTRVILDEWENEIAIHNIVNVFGERNDLETSSGDIKYLESHLIQGQDDVRVVFAKDAITTGWDCPRAEVLVSFRDAKDTTYITQLIGRIVRQPLARRIVSDEALNQVYCLLPQFSEREVEAVGRSMRDPDDTSFEARAKATVSDTFNDDFDDFLELDVTDAAEQQFLDMANAAREGQMYVSPEEADVPLPHPPVNPPQLTSERASVKRLLNEVPAKDKPYYSNLKKLERHVVGVLIEGIEAK